MILAQLIHGLADLHRLQIIHRDMKPENLMIDLNGVVKISLFSSFNYFFSDCILKLSS